MNPQELMEALKNLDRLYLTRDSFRTWLSGNTEARDTYNQEKERIERAFPGFSVVYVDVTFKNTHALVVQD